MIHCQIKFTRPCFLLLCLVTCQRGGVSNRDGPIPDFCRYADMPTLTSADMPILPIPILPERALSRVPILTLLPISQYRHIGNFFWLPIPILPVLKNVPICRYFRCRYWYRPIPSLQQTTLGSGQRQDKTRGQGSFGHERWQMMANDLSVNSCQNTNFRERS